MAKIKYDTSEIKNLLKKQGLSINEFARRINGLCGVPLGTVSSHVQGYFQLTNAFEAAAWCRVLGLRKEQLEKIFKIKWNIVEDSGTSKPVSDSNNTSRNTIFNYDFIEKAIEKSEYSKTQVCKILDISTSSFSNWKGRNKKGPQEKTAKKLATLLGIKVADMYINEENVKKDNEMHEINNTEKTQELSTSLPAGFKNIETKNIHEIFGILNDNILLLAKELDKFTRISESKNNLLEEQINAMQLQLSLVLSNTCTAAPDDEDNKVILQNDNSKKVSINSDKPNCNIEKLISEYNSEDNYSTFCKKINDMVAYIGRKTNMTKNCIFHQQYKKLNEIYGVVYDQLEKDYKEKNNGEKASSTLELIYSDELVREIFYDNICDELSNYIK